MKQTQIDTLFKAKTWNDTLSKEKKKKPKDWMN